MRAARFLRWFSAVFILDITTIIGSLVAEPFTVENCIRSLKHEGKIRLNGGVRPRLDMFPPYCSVKIVSPYGTRIRLKIRAVVPFQCSQRSFLVVIDGWQLVNQLSRRSFFIPEAESTENRQKYFCPDNNGTPNFSEIVTNQNFVEIAYLLDQSAEIEIQVKFESTREGCNQLLNYQDFDKDFTIQSTKPDCRWYLPGMISLKISKIQLTGDPSESTCNEYTGAYLGVDAGRDLNKQKTWKTFCGSLQIPRNLSIPCSHSSLKLHSTGEQKMEVTFSFSRIPTEDYVLNEHRCA